MVFHSCSVPWKYTFFNSQQYWKFQDLIDSTVLGM